MLQKTKPVKGDLWAMIAIDQGDNYATGCLLDYNYFKTYEKVIAINLRISTYEALDADSEAMQEMNFTTNLNQTE